MKEPTKFFESMVVVGLHPSVDVQALHKLILDHNNDYSKRRNLLNYNHQVNAESNLEPQVLILSACIIINVIIICPMLFMDRLSCMFGDMFLLAFLF